MIIYLWWLFSTLQLQRLHTCQVPRPNVVTGMSNRNHFRNESSIFSVSAAEEFDCRTQLIFFPEHRNVWLTIKREKTASGNQRVVWQGNYVCCGKGVWCYLQRLHLSVKVKRPNTGLVCKDVRFYGSYTEQKIHKIEDTNITPWSDQRNYTDNSYLLLKSLKWTLCPKRLLLLRWTRLAF